jgi:pyruvate/2-oxoglutarate dehydrogenase complex dihydrolipoamide dehydrogenase (E3) component
LTDAKGVTEIVTAKNILIATGGRPTPAGIPGEDHAISSDDIFWKQ